MSDASAAQGEFQPQKGSRGPKPKPTGADGANTRGNGAARGKPRADGAAPRKPREPREPRADGAAPRADGAPRAPRGANSNGERKPKNQGDRKPASPKQPREAPAEDPKLVTLRLSTHGDLVDSVLVDALRDAKGDVDEAIKLLNTKKAGSTWSNIVSKAPAKIYVRVDPPVAAPAAPAAAASASDSPAPAAAPAKTQPAKEKPAPKEKEVAKEKPAPVPAPAPVDPEKHIEALSKQIDESVRETESRAQQLKNIQGEIQSISGPRDSKIEQLQQDRSNLLARQQTIREELVKIDSKVKEIDQEVEQIKRDKIEKISVLEKKSVAILAEMKRK